MRAKIVHAETTMQTSEYEWIENTKQTRLLIANECSIWKTVHGILWSNAIVEIHSQTMPKQFLISYPSIVNECSVLFHFVNTQVTAPLTFFCWGFNRFNMCDMVKVICSLDIPAFFDLNFWTSSLVVIGRRNRYLRTVSSVIFSLPAAILLMLLVLCKNTNAHNS